MNVPHKIFYADFFAYINFQSQEPKTMWKNKCSTAIFHMVFGKYKLNSTWIIKSKGKISHVDVPHKIFYTYFFSYINFHAQLPKTIWNIAIFHMVFGKNELNSTWIKKSNDKISQVDVLHKILCAYFFIYITFHTQEPKTMWNKDIFHMVFG